MANYTGSPRQFWTHICLRNTDPDKSARCTYCTEDALQKLRGYFAKKLLIFLGG